MSGLRRVLEYKLGEELPDEEVAGMVDWLLSDAVSVLNVLIVNLLMFRQTHVRSHNSQIKICHYYFPPATVAT